jgi:hypothetical protein
VADQIDEITGNAGTLPPLPNHQVGTVALTHRVPRSGLVVWQGPSVGSTIVEELAPSLAIGIIQTHRHFALVATESRVVGWIDARALIPIRGSGERWMQPASLASVPGVLALVAAAICLFLPFLKLPGELNSQQFGLGIGEAFKIPVEWLWTWNEGTLNPGDVSGFSLGQAFAVLIAIGLLGFVLAILRVRSGKAVARIGCILLFGLAITWMIRCIHFVNQTEDIIRRALGNAPIADDIIAAANFGRFEVTDSGTFGMLGFALLALIAAGWPAPKAQRQR